jgi:homogentisate 1,2-dioxygenase
LEQCFKILEKTLWASEGASRTLRAMSYFMQVGKVPKKRFSQHRQADGTLYAAEVMGEEGFSSAMSMLYHLHTPSAVLDAQAIDGPQHKLVANQPLLPRLMSTSQIAGGADTLSGRQVLCGNADVTVSFVTASGPGALYRNASADELFYIHEGAATLETSFGSIDAVQGDYVVIPRSTTHRWVPSAETPLRALAFETIRPVPPGSAVFRAGPEAPRRAAAGRRARG